MFQQKFPSSRNARYSKFPKPRALHGSTVVRRNPANVQYRGGNAIKNFIPWRVYQPRDRLNRPVYNDPRIRPPINSETAKNSRRTRFMRRFAEFTSATRKFESWSDSRNLLLLGAATWLALVSPFPPRFEVEPDTERFRAGYACVKISGVERYQKYLLLTTGSG